MSKDKKQLVVVGVLVLVVLAIGAFQFMGPKPSPAATEDKGSEKPKDGQLVAENAEKDPMEAYINSLISSSSAPRDPFSPQAVLIDEDPRPDPVTSVAPRPNDPGSTMPNPEIGGGYNPYPVGQGGPPIQGGPTLVPDVGAVNPSDPPYALRGVMIGKKRLCMLEMRDGRQTLVAEGQSFGDNHESRVVQITETHVVLKYRGKEKVLALLGGN